MKRSASALFLSVAVASSAAAQFAPGASDEPIDITGQTLEIVDDVATWTGDVRAVQGEAVLTADRLIAVIEEGGRFKQIRADGRLRYATGKETIAGGAGVYNADARTLTVTGDVMVTQGETVMTGNALVYWIDSGRIRFTAEDGRRIRGVFRTGSPVPQL